jgi:signal peptidase II
MAKLRLQFIHIFIILTLIFIDQRSKELLLELAVNLPITVTSFFNIVLAWNSGVTFGLFNNSGSFIFTIISWGTILVSIFLIVLMVREKCPAKSLPLALIIGGAIGNIMDRFRYGAVVDFLDFHIENYHWPAFNFADSFIVIGVFLYLITSYMKEKNEKT